MKILKKGICLKECSTVIEVEFHIHPCFPFLEFVHRPEDSRITVILSILGHEEQSIRALKSARISG